MFSVQYDKVQENGVRIMATICRPDRLADMRGALYVKALRDLYPESRYMGQPYTVDGQVKFHYDPEDKKLADKLVRSFQHFAFVMMCIKELSGLPYGVPDVKDKDAIHKAYLHFMTEEGQALYTEFSDMARATMEPFTDTTQKPAKDLTDQERADPLSDSPEPNSASLLSVT